ncbi:hypothetical protein D3C73_1440820 [compost metagenome]
MKFGVTLDKRLQIDAADIETGRPSLKYRFPQIFQVRLQQLSLLGALRFRPHLLVKLADQIRQHFLADRLQQVVSRPQPNRFLSIGEFGVSGDDDPLHMRMPLT